MEMKHSLSMQQKPTLIMTQRLQHALKLLQMPTLELQQALKMELERNPLLEEVDEVEEVQEIEEVKKEVGQEEAETPAETEAPAETEVKAEQEVDWGELWPDQFETISSPRTDDGDAEFYERVPVTVKSLGDHLLEQLRLSNLDEQAMIIGDFLIGSIDENGYLQTTVEEVGETFQVSPEKVEEVLAVIQTFEPAGIGARSRLWRGGSSRSSSTTCSPSASPRSRAISSARSRTSRRPATRSGPWIRAPRRRSRPRRPGTSRRTSSWSGWGRTSWWR